MKKPWPTKAVMHQIYDLKLWGGEPFDFYSGEGSHNSKIITPYLEAVIAFLKTQNKALTVCDLGCGDFNVGKQLTKFTKKYIAIDIVKPLIERNKTLFKEDNLEFKCLDIAKDELPAGDCVILRQVLQHLSNTEIQQILNKLTTYKYIILTEHLPMGAFIPNKNIISGQGIRLKHHSGIDLLSAPFSLKPVAVKSFEAIILPMHKGRIETKIYQCF